MSSSTSPEQFREHLFAYPGFFDPKGVHHEFNQGLHGQKTDFDVIPTDSSLFGEWVEVTARKIRDSYDELPEVLIGVADGTNRLVEPVAKELGHKIVGLTTKKVDRSVVVLTPESWRRVAGRKPRFALVVEDVGNEGWNARCAVDSTKKAGAQRVEALISLQRQSRLKRLIGIGHRATLKENIPTFTEKECNAPPDGLCAKGWDLIRYKR